MIHHRSDKGNFLMAEALRLHSLGLSVLPIGQKKKPAIRSWKEYQENAADKPTIRGWFKEPGFGLGIVLGPVSGNLVARDFDTVKAYEAWKRKYPDLAAKLPTVRTKRGFHVYARIPNCKTQTFGDGELRGAGSYVVAPPSAHPDGGQYAWVTPLETLEAVLKLKVDRTGFDREWSETNSGSLCPLRPLSPLCAQESTRRTDDTIPETALKAIEATLPTKRVKRHRAIFELTRWLKGNPEFSDVSILDLKPIVREWHRRALPSIATKEFEETWIDFIDGWERVRVPIGSGILHDAMKRVEEHPLPTVAMQFDNPQFRRLVALCRELQQLMGDAPFYLGCRTPVDFLKGILHKQINRWLNLLVAEGILSIAVESTEFEARRYRYHGD